MKRHENARTQHEERHERDEKVARVGDGAEGRPSQRTGHGLFGRFLTVLHLRDRKGRGTEGGTAVPGSVSEDLGERVLMSSSGSPSC
jgi:hypothetical protein